MIPIYCPLKGVFDHGSCRILAFWALAECFLAIGLPTLGLQVAGVSGCCSLRLSQSASVDGPSIQQVQLA